ncbi:hypothetical protein GCM10010272_13550 [Streptomyces lateritius]|nr:hypothetical protein GCM10010272_13550 [Streptomyces lateritius]
MAAAGAAANAPVDVAAAPMIAALATTTDMTLRLELFKVFPFEHDVGAEQWRRRGSRGAKWGVAVRWSLGWGARAPPPARRPGSRPSPADTTLLPSCT